jgi:hypothetical protein
MGVRSREAVEYVRRNFPDVNLNFAITGVRMDTQVFREIMAQIVERTKTKPDIAARAFARLLAINDTSSVLPEERLRELYYGVLFEIVRSERDADYIPLATSTDNPQGNS